MTSLLRDRLADLRVIPTSVVVVGSGIAGLSTALGHGDAVVLSKTEVGDGSSRWAQGGIAAALDPVDHTAVHAADTRRVSSGLEDDTIVDLVTRAAPDRIRWLVELGARFDRTGDGRLALGREAGHSHHRIVHANGDATGAEAMRTLVSAATSRPDLRLLDHTTAVDVLIADGRAVGVLALDGDDRPVAVLAGAVVLATGGLGRLYRHTTNPPEVTADGLAMAWRAGATVRDPEFVQFHPTALDSTLDPMPLLTEALRGEGAHLLDHDGRRFMLDVHDDGELAPRDVVARQIWRQRRHGPVHLDARMIGPDFPDRFPTVWAIAQRAGLDPRVDLLPVSPAQHFHMGGVATDADGLTSVPGLYACGEAASTGLHGANRLASNSLLEGLVFGARIANRLGRITPPVATAADARVADSALDVDLDRRHTGDAAIDELRGVMWDQVGLVRDADGLRRALDAIEGLAPALEPHPTGRNLLAAARLVTGAALRRDESRGSHHRADHASTDPASGPTLLTDAHPTRIPLPTGAPAQQSSPA